ncbi:hypothetical protein [uncultured Psychroserpens sp.]|uniref:hypothetical protein n=1 Tax=uncultured Psychroserpens sp. TaxID=255436 RepID=UPI00261EC66D|nr:hypothetical protein [uncultured Psychroserpens sp.]
MKQLLFIVVLCSYLSGISQSKEVYLKQNRFDLNSETFNFPQKDFNIIGFGAYHGSAKTEDVELKLLQSLTKDGTIKYYLPETDFSVAHYYNEFMKTGDTLLLKDLVIQNGMHVRQERTIEVYEKWKTLKCLNDKLPKPNRIKILGADVVSNYKYSSKHILKLIDESFKTEVLSELREMVKIDTTSYARGELSYAHGVLDRLIKDYEVNTSAYNTKIKDLKVFRHIIDGIKNSMAKKQREPSIYDNYLFLKEHYNFENQKPFMRIGFWHLEKSREGKNANPPFFTKLIENEIYPKDKVISVIGYFTESEVVWNELYDDNGNYTGYTIEGGFGIGDYEKEYFRGIQNLKNTKLSDKTLFRLNSSNTPYSNNEPDLIDIIMTDEKSNSEAVKGMPTIDFLDYAILISNSKASTPIYELDHL